MTDLPITREQRITVRALLLGDRIETAGLERSDVLSTLPLAFRAGEKGIVALFRYGVAVLVGMSPLEEDEVIRRLDGRVVGPIEPREEETVQIEIAPDKDDQLTPSGVIVLKALTTEHTLLIADALATSVVLAHDEKNVATVFDVIQPIAQELAEHGRTPGGRRAILKHIGNALLVQHRVSGLVAVAEKPDVLWERPVLERFYARLEDEYELKERADVLTRKLTVISDSAKAFADIIDTERSLRLEADHRRADRRRDRHRRISTVGALAAWIGAESGRAARNDNCEGLDLCVFKRPGPSKDPAWTQASFPLSSAPRSA